MYLIILISLKEEKPGHLRHILLKHRPGNAGNFTCPEIQDCYLYYAGEFQLSNSVTLEIIHENHSAPYGHELHSYLYFIANNN